MPQLRLDERAALAVGQRLLDGQTRDFIREQLIYRVVSTQYDGTSVWVTNNGTDNVSKINAAAGTKIDYPTGAGPVDVAYVGANIWVANVSDNTVSKIVP